MRTEHKNRLRFLFAKMAAHTKDVSLLWLFRLEIISLMEQKDEK